MIGRSLDPQSGRARNAIFPLAAPRASGVRAFSEDLPKLAPAIKPGSLVGAAGVFPTMRGPGEYISVCSCAASSSPRTTSCNTQTSAARNARRLPSLPSSRACMYRSSYPRVLQLNVDFTAAYGRNLFPSRGTPGAAC